MFWNCLKIDDHRTSEGHSSSSWFSRKNSPVDLVGLFLSLYTDPEKEMQQFLDYKDK